MDRLEAFRSWRAGWLPGPRPARPQAPVADDDFEPGREPNPRRLQRLDALPDTFSTSRSPGWIRSLSITASCAGPTRNPLASGRKPLSATLNVARHRARALPLGPSGPGGTVSLR